MADAALATPEVLTIPEAAALCRVSPAVMYRGALAGEVPAMKVGGQWRLLRSVLLRWLDGGGACSTSTPAARSGGAKPRGRGGNRSGSRSTAPRTPKPTAPQPSDSEQATSTRARLLRAVKGI